jgi:hypothetical protein
MAKEETMEFPNPFKVREEFSAIVRDVDFLIETMKTNNKMTFSEYLAQHGSINIELIKMEGRIDGLIASDAISRIKSEGTFKENKQYKKASRELEKITAEAIIKSNDIEHRHLGYNLHRWESEFQQGRLRKDLIKHFEKISRQLKAVQRIV